MSAWHKRLYHIVRATKARDWRVAASDFVDRLILPPGPFDPNDAMILEGLERFRKDEVSRTFRILKPRLAEFCSARAFQQGHDPVIPDHALKMPVMLRILPKGVNFRLSRFLHDIGEACVFCF